jgi:N-acetylmuramoyl-L-alanine amidase
MHVIRRGDRGDAVVEIRAILTTLRLLDDTGPDADAVYDGPVERAVRAFQQARGLHVTGDVNEETWQAIDAARWHLGSRVLAHEQPEPLFGDDIMQLQERLLELGYDLGRADGIFGRRTAAAVARFQREVGLVSDGVCGPQTFAALRRLGRKVIGGRPNLLRETERFRAAGPALVDKRIVIDPGHGGGDPGVSVPDGTLRWTEADIAYDLASRLEGRLAAAGMRVHLTRGPSPSARLSEFDRASLANELGADLLISIHLDGHANPAASGVATYHFGQYGEAGVTSTLGERLAALVQREIVARTGLRDCRTHAKTWDLLRLTRMPTVRVEAGYLTSREDRDRLVDPLFRDRLVAAIVASVKRMYLPIESDVSTGSIDVDTLRPTTALVTTATGAIERSSGAPNGRAERAERTARADRPAQASRPERGERPERPVADSGAEAPSDRSIAGTDRSTGETDRSVDRAVHAAGRWRVIDAEQADRPA